MNTTNSEWKRPPVIEVVIGMHFSPLPGFNNGHLGRFWFELEDDYPIATDAPSIAPVIAKFEGGPEYGFPGISFAPDRGESRLQMRSPDGSRMVQVQNGWLIVNWMKQEGPAYPGYSGLLQEFQKVRQMFLAFVASSRLGPLKPKVWEVTYIDHIAKGTVWKEIDELPRVVPGLLGACEASHGQMESISGTWVFNLQPAPGKLVISLQTARTTAEPHTEVLVVKSIARGPIRNGELDPLIDGLNTGHAGAVETFKNVTSREAQTYWKG